MKESLIAQTRSWVASRRAEPSGGFAQRAGGTPRPDATAWALLALREAGESQAVLANAGRFLSGLQLADGRVLFSTEERSSWWPTSLALLAFRAVAGFEGEAERAAAFLLQKSGAHFKKKSDSPTGHDTEIRGWPWIEETHSWVEPTALAVIALRASGRAGHARVGEAVRMLMDRQLPGGGWNYGNTTVFGQELLPMPDATGLALAALSGMTNKEAVAKSLAYAQTRAPGIDAPFSLFWLTCGLSAWGSPVPDLAGRIRECLMLQERRGAYTTTLLAMLLLALASAGDVLSRLGVR